MTQYQYDKQALGDVTQAKFLGACKRKRFAHIALAKKKSKLSISKSQKGLEVYTRK